MKQTDYESSKNEEYEEHVRSNESLQDAMDGEMEEPCKGNCCGGCCRISDGE